MPSPSTL
jgi:hypothetical protein